MTGSPFAFGTFGCAGDDAFGGLVIGGRVTRLDRHLGEGTSVRSLLDSWDESLPLLQALADRLAPDGCEHTLEDLRPLPPVDWPGQLFQAGANYKQHLV